MIALPELSNSQELGLMLAVKCLVKRSSQHFVNLIPRLSQLSNILLVEIAAENKLS